MSVRGFVVPSQRLEVYIFFILAAGGKGDATETVNVDCHRFGACISRAVLEMDFAKVRLGHDAKEVR